jgi:hydroxymethylpyrimidine/phosphomethylpyrimidine kinase
MLYAEGERLESWTWPRLPHQYHGSGCTFASSLTAYFARGMNINDATYSAQHYTWLSLKRGFKAGQGQLLPFRLKQIS